MRLDQIEVSVTHEIKINGDKSWVGTRLVATVDDGETATECHQTLDALVQLLVMRSIESTVKTVEEYTS